MACTVTVSGGVLTQAEIDAYIFRATQKYGCQPINIDIKVDGDFVELDYEFELKPFHRIRRITGYLVGSLERFNSGKQGLRLSIRIPEAFACWWQRPQTPLNAW